MKKLILLLLFLTIDTAFAHEETLKHDPGWNPVSAGPVTTWTAPLCGEGKFVIQPFFFYNRSRGTFNSEGHYDSLAQGNKKYQFQQQLFLQFGLSDTLEIDGQLIYQENYVKQGDLKAAAKGLGDSYLFLRYCTIEETEKMPQLTGILQIKAPTGKYQHADPNKLGTGLMGATSGGGSWDHGYGFIASKKIKPLILHLDALYSFANERKIDNLKTKYGGYLNYDFGIEYFLQNNFNLMLEFNGFSQADKEENGDKVPASDIKYFAVAPGIGWSNSSIQTLLAYQRTLAGTNTDANDSLVLTFVYTF